VAHGELEGFRSRLCSLVPVSATISYFPRRSFFPPTTMSASKEHIPGSFDKHLRYAECRAQQIVAIGARFNSPQEFGPRDLDPWDCPLRHGAYGFCIHCLATSLAATLIPRELPPARLCDGIQVRARRISPLTFCLTLQTKLHPCCHRDPNRNAHRGSHICRWMYFRCIC
jgi:hypothetical protein